MELVFLAGASRSGSTVLSRVLSTQGGLFHVGELTFLWERGIVGNELCGCGAPLRECEFWRAVLRDAFGRADGPDEALLQRLIAARHAVDDMPRMFFGRVDLAAHSDYVDAWRRLLSALAERAHPRTILDSSKRPSHGMFLSRLARLHTVHVVRDSRAVAFSASRVRMRPETGDREAMPTNRAWRTALRWEVQNRLAARLRSVSTSYALVRYEDFADEPMAASSKILADAGLLVDAAAGSQDGELELAVEHTVSGNPMRFSSGRVRVARDDEWQRAMPTVDRRLVTALSAPSLHRYGYLQGARRA
jgi:hypothetical protein